MMFEVGDIIKANSRNNYGITNNKGLYEVLEVFDDYVYNDIRVKVIDHEISWNIGNKHQVCSDYFYKFKEVSHKNFMGGEDGI